MDTPTVASKPCCVCAAQNGKHCAKCKSRHYCSKKCQLVDCKRGHNKACRQLAADFQDRLLDELMPEKKPKEVPAIVEDVSQADGAKARLSAVSTAETADAVAPNDDAPSLRGICAICLDVLPLEPDRITLYECCCTSICTACSVKCRQHDTRCPLCRAQPPLSAAEAVRRLQKGAEQGFPRAQYNLGLLFYDGRGGVAQLYDEAVKWFRLAAAQGHPEALFNLGSCYANGKGVPRDMHEALRLCKRAAAMGKPGAAATVDKLLGFHAAARAA